MMTILAIFLMDLIISRYLGSSTVSNVNIQDIFCLFIIDITIILTTNILKFNISCFKKWCQSSFQNFHAHNNL